MSTHTQEYIYISTPVAEYCRGQQSSLAYVLPLSLWAELAVCLHIIFSLDIAESATHSLLFTHKPFFSVSIVFIDVNDQYNRDDA